MKDNFFIEGQRKVYMLNYKIFPILILFTHFNQLFSIQVSLSTKVILNKNDNKLINKPINIS